MSKSSHKNNTHIYTYIHKNNSTYNVSAFTQKKQAHYTREYFHRKTTCRPYMWLLSHKNNKHATHTACAHVCECHQTKITTHTHAKAHTQTPKHTHTHTQTNKHTHTQSDNHTHAHTHTYTLTHTPHHILHMRMPLQKSNHTFRKSPRMMSVFSALSCASSSNIMLEKNQTPFISFRLSVKPVNISHTWSGVENVLI